MRANEGNSYGYLTNRVGAECQSLKKLQQSTMHLPMLGYKGGGGGGHRQGDIPLMGTFDHFSYGFFFCFFFFFCGGRKTGEPREKKPSEQGREPTTNSAYTRPWVWESNPSHIGGGKGSHHCITLLPKEV